MSSVTDQPPTAELPRKAQKLLQPGTKAPDFKLNVAPDKSLKLGDLAGKPVVLAFYRRTEVRSAEISSPSTVRLSRSSS